MSGIRAFRGLQKIFLGIILCFGIWGSAQQHPVRITPVMTPPYSLLLPEIAQSSQDKIQLHILMTDLNEPSHQVSLRFKLLSGTSSSVIAQSTPFVNGLPTQNLLPGQPIILSNLDIRPLFKLQNLAGINPQQYAKPLPQGLYQFCFQVIDQHTRRELSNFSCVPVYLQQYEPPFLTLPKNAEIIQKQNEFQNILFQWMPRQIAPNTQYTFTLKEINDNLRDPQSAFLTARTLWQENTLAPNLFYGIDKTPLITGKRYAWQVKATSANPALPNFSINPNDDTGIYQNNGLSEIFFFDYTEHCALPKFLIAKNQGRGKTQILWSFNQYQPNKQYLVQYRKKDSHKDWAEIKTYAENAFITNLEDLTTYEYRVGASCNQTTDGRVQFAFSDIQTFTTDSKQTQNQNYQCGVMPNIDLANQQLFQGSLGANDTFTAGDFPVTIISAEGNNGIFSGKGYIQVPYLADTKIIVAFDNISINTDRKLINGVLETEYDAEEKNVVEVDLFKDDFIKIDAIVDKGIANDELSQEEYDDLIKNDEEIRNKISEKIKELEEEGFITKEEAQEYRDELEKAQEHLKGVSCIVENEENTIEQPTYGKSFYDIDNDISTQKTKNCSDNLKGYANDIKKSAKKISEKANIVDKIKKIKKLIDNCSKGNKDGEYIPRCFWDHNYNIPYLADFAFTSGVIDGFIEAGDTAIKIVDVVSCHNVIQHPTYFFTPHCENVRKETRESLYEVIEVIIDEDKRKLLVNTIGQAVKDYAKETAGFDNQARYNQGKLLSGFILGGGAGTAVKSTAKATKIITNITTRIKNIKPNDLKKVFKNGIKVKTVNWGIYPKIKNKFPISKNGWLMGKYENGKLNVIGNTKIAQKWDFIVKTNGEILVGRKHSWLSKGEDVLAAGELKFRDGVLVEISNASGHYLPTIKETSNFLKIFKQAGINIDNVTLTILKEDGLIFKQITPSSKVRKQYTD